VESFKRDYLPEEVDPYLDGVRKKAPRYFPILLTMPYVGLRVGEAIALKWGSIDWNGKFLIIQEASWKGILGTPKTESSIRSVDISPETIAILEQNRKAIAAQSLKAGRPMDCSKIRRAHELGLRRRTSGISGYTIFAGHTPLGGISGSTCLTCLKVSRAF
jgi:integrase